MLLDLDGTLSEAGPAITAAVAAALAHVGHDALDARALHAFVGPPLEDSFAALGLSPSVVDEATRVYRASYDLLSSPLYSGVPELLRRLRDHGLRLALATSKPQSLAEAVVEGTGLSGLLDLVVGSDRAGGRATKGHVVAEALRLLSPVGHAVMVGDRSHDVVGAQACRLPCIGVLWGYGTAEELTSAGAAALVASPEQLGDLLTTGR